jgi:hypothetical protein
MARAAALLRQGLSKGVHSSYGSQVFGPNGYATVLSNVKPGLRLWPASLLTVSVWLSVASLVLSADSLCNYLSGLRAYHLHQGLSWAFEGGSPLELLRLLKKGLKRDLLSRDAGRREARPAVFPFRPWHLLAISQCVPAVSRGALADSHNGRLFLAVAAVATFAALRGGEFLSQLSAGQYSAALRRSALSFSPSFDSLIIVLPRSKTSPSRPVEVWLPAITFCPGLCPVTLMRDYLDRSVLPADPRAALFRSAGGSQLCDSTLARWAHMALHAAGLAIPRGFAWSRKSFRAGDATAVDRLGPLDPDQATKDAGRWASQAFATYTRERLAATVLAVARKAQELVALRQQRRRPFGELAAVVADAVRAQVADAARPPLPLGQSLFYDCDPPPVLRLPSRPPGPAVLHRGVLRLHPQGREPPVLLGASSTPSGPGDLV